MKLSDHQANVAAAYTATFSGDRDSQAVLDDILETASAMTGPEAAGALRLYGHIMLRCTLARRAARKPEPQPAKRVALAGGRLDG